MSLRLGRFVLEHDGAYLSGNLPLASFSALAKPGARALVEIESDDGTLTPAIAAGIEWVLAHGAELAVAARDVLLDRYPDLARRAPSDVPMPPTLTAQTLKRHVDLRSVHFHRAQRGAVPYVGLLFGCSWDDEHGLGLMMHGTRCVELGGADTAILGWIAERDAGPAKKPAAKKTKKTAAKKRTAKRPATKRAARRRCVP